VPHAKHHPEHAEVVRSMYRLRVAGWSYERVATKLTAEGIPAPAVVAGHKRQGDRWHASTERLIVQDRAYMGQGQWFKTTYVRDDHGRRLRRRAAGEQEPTDVAYPPLVTEEEWHAANKPDETTRACAVRATADSYLFYGGMVRCALHGTAMTGSRGNRAVRYYRCQRRIHPGGRVAHGVRAQPLEEAVWQTICAAMLDEELMVAAAERIALEAEHGLEVLARRKSEIATRLEKLARERRTFFSEMRAAGATAADMAEQVAVMQEEESRLRSELELLTAQIELQRSELPKAQEIKALCELFTEQARDATPATKRALLEALETTVTVDGERFRIDGVLRPLGLEGEVGVHKSKSLS
jgi:Recombinase/Recombinase zinc beta ribbon domain